MLEKAGSAGAHVGWAACEKGAWIVMLLINRAQFIHRPP
jgi:hypothetical protein